MKKYQPIVEVLTKRSRTPRTQRPGTSMVHWLLLTLAILIFPALVTHTGAQKGPPPKEKYDPPPPPKADLVPVDTNANGSFGQDSPYCWISMNPPDNKNALDLNVRVANKGTANAPATHAAVTWAVRGNAPVSETSVPAILYGRSAVVKFRVPYGCFDPATQFCSFEIGVDSRDEVEESNQYNNKVLGRCKNPNPAKYTRWELPEQRILSGEAATLRPRTVTRAGV